MSAATKKRYPTIAVSGLSASDNPNPGVGVIRCLRADPDFDGRIVGLTYDAMDSGIFDPELADSVYLLPYPSAGKRQLAERIASIAERESVDVLLPTLDSEMPAITRLDELIPNSGLGTFLPTPSQLAAREKSRISELAARCGVPAPRTRVITSASQLPRALEEIGFPAYVKGLYYEAESCESLDEAHAVYNKISASWGLPVIVQAAIRGEEYDIAILGDGEGELLGSVPMKKMVINDAGKAWAGVTVSDPALSRIAEAFVAELEWRGPAEIELIRSTRDGELHLVEINPRFPAWIYLSAAAGVNLPSMYARLASGLKVEPVREHAVGKMFVRVVMDLIAEIGELDSIATSGRLQRMG